MTVYKNDYNKKFYLLFTMATGTGSLGLSSTLVYYMRVNTTTQGAASVTGADVYFIPPTSSNFANEKIPFTVYFPTEGRFKLYITVSRSTGTADTISFYDPKGVLLNTFTGTGGNFELPENTKDSGNRYSLVVNCGTTITFGAYTNLFHIGYNRVMDLSYYVRETVISNLLTLGTGESFTATSTGVVIVLNRIFTVGTLAIFRFTSNNSGSFTVTSNNTSIAESGLSTSFSANQDIGDYVDILETTIGKTPLTLTVTFANSTGELPTNVIVTPV
jgi:hypothetical protein